jgi:uncharacterized protein (TIGR01777 family)
MRVFVTGGTGLIGSRLIRKLLSRGDQVQLLTRRYAAARQIVGHECGLVEGDPTQAGDWMKEVAECDAVVHLAGENIFARRWNAAFKAALLDSRVRSTQHVVEALSKNPTRVRGGPKVLVNASAIGYYGPHGDEELTEESPPGSDFMADICVQWEEAARKVEGAGVRCTMLRIGIVLDSAGGALKQMLTPFKIGAGGPVGNGRQWMSWIHHEDITGLLLLQLDNAEARGPLNGTAPNPVTNRAFGKALGAALHRPAFLPTPAFALRLALGEVAQVVTTGQRVLPKRALALGYQFKYPTIEAALKQILGP